MDIFLRPKEGSGNKKGIHGERESGRKTAFGAICKTQEDFHIFGQEQHLPSTKCVLTPVILANAKPLCLARGRIIQQNMLA